MTQTPAGRDVVKRGRLEIPRGELRALGQTAPFVSLLKCAVFFVSIVLGAALQMHFQSTPGTFFSVAALGTIFAHGLELQHEALHGNLFRNARVNEFVGVLFGLPMLVSFTHYRSYHFHHHRSVGTSSDEELFNYEMSSLRNPWSLAARAWNIQKVPVFALTVIRMARGIFPPKVKRTDRRRLLRDYILLTMLLVIATSLIALFGIHSLLFLWIIPWLLVAEPLHFLIEVPEHLGCVRHSRSMLANTRSYRAHPVWGYVANHNNYHIEHHLFPAIPSHRLALLHPYVVAAGGHCSSGYCGSMRELLAASRRVRDANAAVGGA